MSIIDTDTAGVVSKVLVAPGDGVNVGDVVVILESMKMEIPIESEDSGTVASIHVNPGETVADGDPIVTLS